MYLLADHAHASLVLGDMTLKRYIFSGFINEMLALAECEMFGHVLYYTFKVIYFEALNTKADQAAGANDEYLFYIIKKP